MKAVFLDRDGVLNRDSPGFIKTPDELEILPGVPEAIAKLNAAGFAAIVISNQSGIGRGLFTEEALDAIHMKLREETKAAGGQIRAIYHCPHRPDEGCECRKPSTVLIQRAAQDHGVEPAQSWFVGDKPIDIACGSSAGCRTVFVLSGLERTYDRSRFDPQPDYVSADLAAAAGFIVRSDE